MAPSPFRRDSDATRWREVYGEWTLSTTTPSGVPYFDAPCAISQVQFDERTCKRLLVIELRPIRGRIAGALLLPAGLSRKQGVVLQFEESAPGSSQRFLAQFKGCLVDLDLDETTVEKLASSRYLHITAEAERGGEVNFAIPLNGLANALARARSIGKHFS